MTTIRLLTHPNNTTVGADPEVFFMKEEYIFPACGLVGGTKKDPIPVEGGALQEDNIMAEINIDPSSNCEDFITNINKVYSNLLGIASNNDCTIGILASAFVEDFVLAMNDKSSEFGCEPDYNAYSLSANPTPDPSSNIRTCAGHIHLGYEVDGGHTFKSSAHLVKYLDAYVGTYCVVTDSDTLRMSRYGQAGAFRPKSYGVEYRVPSNFWLKSDSLKKEIFYRIKLGYTAAFNNTPLPSTLRTVSAINTQDKHLCKEILKCLN